MDLPLLIVTRGNRSWSALTQAGTKLEMPFFQLPNHRNMTCRLFFRAPASSPSTSVKSYLPSTGSIQSHATATRTVLRFICTSRGQTGSM